MLEFFGKIFTGFLSILAVLILILGIVAGVFFVNETYYRPSGGQQFVGGLVGFVVTFIFDIMAFGVIGIFVEMRDTQNAIKSELREVKEMMKKAEKNSKASGAASANEAPKRVLNPSAFSNAKFVTCPKCGTENSDFNNICSKCGSLLK